MPDSLRIAVAGLTHDHIWDHLDDLAGSPSSEFVGAAEADGQLRSKIEKQYGCPTWNDWQQMLDDVELDGIYVYASNQQGATIATSAAERGLHVMIEKPMAANYSGAREMRDASVRNNVRLVVNWPFAWWPQMQHALRCVEDGKIGRVWQVKYRAAHAGPAELGCSEQFCDWLFDEEANGGGAMMDYCCYGTTLARAILGQPDEVVGISGRFCKTELPVEDNALIVMRREDSMATAEASWTQIGELTSYTTAIYGTEGTLVIEPRMGGRLLLATTDQPMGSVLKPPGQEEHMKSATEYFLHQMRGGQETHALCRSDVCCDSQEILEAGKLSMATGRTVSLPLKT